MKERIFISLSLTKADEWETQVELDPGFDKVETSEQGVRTAFDIDGNVLSVFVPELTRSKHPVNEDNMGPKEVITGTPDGETAIIEQNPTNTDIIIAPTDMSPNPLVPNSGYNHA